MTDTSPPRHLDPHEVTGYLEAALSTPDRGRVEAHLADCEECAAELVAVGRLRGRTRAPTRWLGAAAAAAAVVAVVLLGPRVTRKPGETPSPVRGDSVSALRLVAPSDGADLAGAPVFAWRSVPGAAAYRIMVSRADGDSVWAATTRDTTARPPQEALAAQAEPYYWYVDALLADGRSVSGTPHRFRLGQ